MLKTLKTNTKKLLKDIASFKASYQSNVVTAHTLLVSSLSHAAEHGDADPLNAFMSILTSNDKEAAANFIRRVSAAIGGWDLKTIPTSLEMESFISNGAFLTKTKEGYRVLTNQEHKTSKAAKSKMTVLAPQIINPDGTVWKLFLTKNNMAERKTFGDANVIEALDRLIKTATKGKKNTTSEVSPQIIKALEAAQKAIGVPSAAIH